MVLACGFGLWLLSLAGYRLGGRHFPAPQRVIDIAALPCIGNPPLYGEIIYANEMTATPTKPTQSAAI